MTDDNGGFVDYYALFEVAPDATEAEIRTAFMRLAKQQHPDAGGSLEAMQQLNLAYATLRTAATRRAYDMMHSFQTGTSALHYRETPVPPRGSENSLEDDEIDDFINTIFAEYAIKTPKPNLYDKARSALAFRKPKDS